MDFASLDPADRDVVVRALALVGRVSPPHLARIYATIPRAVFRVAACERGASTCTGGVLAHDLAFAEHPADLGVEETAKLLVHESLHHDPRSGTLIQHAFRGRPTARQMAADGIYAETEAVAVRFRGERCPDCGGHHSSRGAW